MNLQNPNSSVKEILEQTKWFSYEDLDILVYHLQGIQIKMMDEEKRVISPLLYNMSPKTK